MKQYILEVADDGTPTIRGLAPPMVRPKTLSLRGVNLTGGDCPFKTWGGAAPINGRNYKFVSDDFVKQMVAAGCNHFRVVFTWEALSVSGESYRPDFSTTYGKELDRVCKAISSAGASYTLDLHGGSAGVFKSSFQPASLGLFWKNVLLKLGGRSGITNEPHDTPPMWEDELIGVMDKASESGFGLLYPAPTWSAASAWVTTGAADRFVSTRDRLASKVFPNTVQLHLYFDKDSSGTTSDVVSDDIGVARVTDATLHARKNGYKLFLGEVGVPNTDGCKAWDNLHNYMLDNADVWEGFTAWAAGPSDWWGNNRFYCGPGSKSLANMKKALTGA